MRRLALILALPLVALAGCTSVRPKVAGAVGWRSTPEVTGPAFDFDFGEYEGEVPFAPAKPDPAVADGLKAVETRYAAAEGKIAALQAKVDSGTLPPAEADRITKALATADASVQAAREATAAAAAADAKAVKAEAAAHDGDKPSGIPWEAFGGLGATVGVAFEWLRRKANASRLEAAEAARTEADRAKAEALAAQKRAIVAVDNLPNDADTPTVEAVISGAHANVV